MSLYPKGLVSSEEEEMGTQAHTEGRPCGDPGRRRRPHARERGLGRDRPPTPGSGAAASRRRGRRWPWHSSCPHRLTNKVARNTLGVSGRKEGTGQSLGKTTNSPEKDKIQPELEADLDKG